MKWRLTSVCLAACLLLASCRTAGETPPVAGTALVPAETGSLTVTYTAESAQGAAKKHSYEANQAQIDALYVQLANSLFVPLDDDDRLAYTTLAVPEAAGLSLTFSTGEILSFYEEGAAMLSRDGETGFWSAEPDALYALYQLLIPDFQAWYAVKTEERPYAPPSAFHPERLEEVALYLPGERFAYPLKEGFLALSVLEDDRIRCVRYDEQGGVEWSKDYEVFRELSDKAFTFLALKDGGFLLAADGHDYYQESGILLRCGENGDIRWSTVLPDKSTGAICRLFETPEGDILTVGRLSTSYRADDLLLMKFSAEGEQIARRVYGGSDFDSFHDAVYSPKAGLAVLLDTQSCDGDITTRGETGDRLYPRAMVVSFDEDLQEKWQVIWKPEDDIYAAGIALNKDSLIVAGNLSGESGRFGKTLVVALDAEGRRTASAELEEAGFPHLSTDGGKIRLALNTTMGDETGAAKIVELDDSLRIVRITEDAPGLIGDYRIFGTQDGGFFARQIVALSAHPWSGRGTDDEAVILSRFDPKGRLAARKVYDRSHCTGDEDKVLPLPDGRVLTRK